MNELALGKIPPGDYTIQLGFEALKGVRIAAENTTTACRAIHSDTATMPEGGRHVQANEISFKITNRALPLVDKATQNFSTEITRLQNKIAAPAVDGSIRAVQMATELRIFLRDSTPEERRKQITRSLESGDDQVMSAIVTAPPMLSGLSSTEVEAFPLMWRTKRRTKWREFACSKRRSPPFNSGPPTISPLRTLRASRRDPRRAQAPSRAEIAVSPPKFFRMPPSFAPRDDGRASRPPLGRA